MKELQLRFMVLVCRFLIVRCSRDHNPISIAASKLALDIDRYRNTQQVD
jgi:hypothetical protein